MSQLSFDPDWMHAPAADQAVLSVLLADADEQAANALAAGLLEHNIRATVCTDGAEALLQVGVVQPDVVVLASRLPVVAGSTFVRVLRSQATIPVIVGVGPGDAEEAINALAAGATACVALPFRIQELLPMLHPVPEPRSSGRPWSVEPATLTVGTIQLNWIGHEVRVDGHRIHLAPREFELLAYLMANADRVVSTRQIQDAVWGRDHPGMSNTIQVHIRRLRRRLGDDLHNPHIILSVRRLGYRLVVPDAPATSNPTRAQG